VATLPSTSIVQVGSAIYTGGTPTNLLTVTLAATGAGNRLCAVAAGYNGIAIASIQEGSGTPGGSALIAPEGVATAYDQVFMSAPCVGGATSIKVKLTGSSTDYWVVYVFEVTPYWSVLERHVMHTGTAGTSYTNGTTLAPSITDHSPGFGLVWVNGGAVTIAGSQGYFNYLSQVNNATGASTLAAWFDGTSEGGITYRGSFTGTSGVYVSLAIYLTMVRTGTGTLVLPKSSISGAGELRQVPAVPRLTPGDTWLRRYWHKAVPLVAYPALGAITGTGTVTSKKSKITGQQLPGGLVQRAQPGQTWLKHFQRRTRLWTPRTLITGTGSITGKKSSISGYGLPPASSPPARAGRTWIERYRHPTRVLTGATPWVTGTGRVTSKKSAVGGGGSGSRVLIMSLAPQAGIDPYGNAYPQGLGLSEGVIPGGLIQDGTIGAIQLQGGINVPGIVNATEIQASVILQYTGPPAAGNLFYSNSPGPGTDEFGNTYPQGETYYGVANVTSAFSVENLAGATLTNIDTDGNINGQVITAGQDVVIAGNSLQNDVLPSFPTGLLNRGWTPDGVWPATPIAQAETPLIELDQVLTAGRAYRFRIIPAEFRSSANNTLVLRLRYTADGSVPSTSSVLLREDASYGSIADPEQSPYVEITMAPNATGNYRMLVTGYCTVGTFQFARLLEVQFEDIGLATALNQANNGVILGTGTGGGTGKQTYVKSYYPAHTYSYYGCGVSTPVCYSLLNTDGTMGQGPGPTFSGAATLGNQTSYILWPYAQIKTDLTGATINYCQLRLYLLNCAESSINVDLGWNSFGAYGGSDGGGGNEGVFRYSMTPGQVLNQTLTNDWASRFLTGQTSFQLGRPPTILGIYEPSYGGTFYGRQGDLSYQPMLTISYTK
jgi:hypothetical protein